MSLTRRGRKTTNLPQTTYHDIKSGPVSEKSALESVVGFVADVVPQVTAVSDDKESILWVKQEQFVNPVDKCKDPTIIIIIGYTNGVQVYQLQPPDWAQEIISHRQGPMKIYTVIHRFKQLESSPLISDYLIASADDCLQSMNPFSTLKVTSTSTGEMIWKHSFKNTINEVVYNRKLLLITFSSKIAAFDLFNFKPVFTLSGCYPSEGPNLNPVCLGSSWLAYSESRLVNFAKSHGESDASATLTYTAAVLNTAKNVAKGVSTISESLINNITGSPKLRRESGSSPPLSAHNTPGVVTVVNCDKLKDHFQLDGPGATDALVSHFQALSHPVAYLKFDPSGSLLFTACSEGQNFHIYQLIADVYGSSQAGVQHLYVLHRGDTTAQVLDVTFSIDSRWVGVCTARGTTHLFPINTYGGQATARTHVNQFTVNKATRYEKSSGLEEVVDSSVKDKLASPALVDSVHATYLTFNNGALENPVLRSYTDPCVIEPLSQIKLPLSAQCVSHKLVPSKNIAACFAVSLRRNRRDSFGPKAMQAFEVLYVITSSGVLTEYKLQPFYDCDYDQISDATKFTVKVTPRCEWLLVRTHSHKESKRFSAERFNAFNPGCEGGRAHYGSKDSISSDTGSSNSAEYDDEWFAQVELVTCSGPNRRLWMGPQFKFKTYNNDGVALCSHSPALLPSMTPGGHSDMNYDSLDLDSLQINNHSTSPMAMPSNPKRKETSGGSWKQRIDSHEDLFIEAGSFDPSPRLAITEPVFDPYDAAVEYRQGDAFTNNLLADAMIEQKTSSDDLMFFPPGS